MNKYVFIDSNNEIKGVCTSERKITADEVYPNMKYSAVQVDDAELISNFAIYEFDGANFKLKEIPVSEPMQPSEVELLQQDVGQLLLESATDKARIADLESLTGALLLEIATLKGGTA